MRAGGCFCQVGARIKIRWPRRPSAWPVRGSSLGGLGDLLGGQLGLDLVVLGVQFTETLLEHADHFRRCAAGLQLGRRRSDIISDGVTDDVRSADLAPRLAESGTGRDQFQRRHLATVDRGGDAPTFPLLLVGVERLSAFPCHDVDTFRAFALARLSSQLGVVGASLFAPLLVTALRMVWDTGELGSFRENSRCLSPIDPAPHHRSPLLPTMRSVALGPEQVKGLAKILTMNF